MTCDCLHRVQRLVVIEEVNAALNGCGVAVSALRELVGEIVSDFGVPLEVGSVEEDQSQGLLPRNLGGNGKLRLAR